MTPAPKPTIKTPVRFANAKAERTSLASLPTAHRIIALANLGHPVGVAAVNQVIDGAAGGDHSHIQNGNVLSIAQALQIRAQFTAKWRGQAAANAILYPPQARA